MWRGGRTSLTSAKRIADQPAWWRRIVQDQRRAFADAWRRLRSQPFGTPFTAFVIGVVLALPAGLDALIRTFNVASYSWEGAYQASLFLKDSVSAERGRQLAADIGRREGIEKSAYISREQALAEFRAHSSYGEALDLLQSNPLPAVIVVTPDRRVSHEQASELLTTLSRLPEVDEAKLDQEWLDRLYALLDFIERVIAAIAVLLGLAVVVVIGNTIRLDVESRRDEIMVMKQVGATDAFIRRPFLYTGLAYGFLGSVFATLLVTFGLALLTAPTLRVLGLDASHSAAMLPSRQTVAMVFGAGLGLAWVTSFLTVTRQIRGIEPR
jgi:cell division transport system permease protein